MNPEERAAVINDILDKLERLGLIRYTDSKNDNATPGNLAAPQ